MRVGPARSRAVALLPFCILFLAFDGVDRAQAISSGIIETYVGGGNGDGADALNATISPRGMGLSGNPNAPDIYVADSAHHRVRRVDGDTGLIDTVAGNGVGAFAGDGGFAQNASLFLPWDVAVDGAGNVYIADVLNNRVRKVGTDGRISTVAGNGQQSYSGDDGLAAQEALNQPFGVAVGPDGNVYIADSGNNRIRKLSPPGCSSTTCQIDTVVGSGASGLADNVPATQGTLRGPADVAFDANGIMYIADKANHRIRRVANGIITTVAGGGSSQADGVLGILTALSSPSGVATDSNGNVYIADTGYRRIRMLQAGSLIISTVAGTGDSGSEGDGGPATRADLFSPYGVAATTPGTFWLSQSITAPVSQYNRVRKVSNTIIDSVIGGGLGDGGAALDALVDPQGAEAVDAGGLLPDLYFADGQNHVVRYVDGNTATIETIAGTGVSGYGGDGGAAVNATLNSPSDVAYYPAGAIVYIADTLNNVIRKISANGTITTAAGDGDWGFDGDGSATQLNLAAPNGIDVDRNGVLYIADTSNNRVRKVVNGQISTVAGNGNWGSGPDNVAATQSALRSPADIVIADNGTLYIADTQSNKIRRVSTAGIITTIAGTGTSGFSGDNGPATAARLYAPSFLTLDQGGNLFIADSNNKRVRRINAANQVIETVAGNGQSGVSGDGGQATAASFSDPSGVAIDPSGASLFVSANLDGSVRVVDFGGGAPLPTASYTATAIPPTNTAVPTNPSTPTRTPTIPTPTRTPTIPTPTRTSTQAPVNLAVSGHVGYYANHQVHVPGVAVGLSGPQIQTVHTNSSGNYSASNMAVGTWVIEPEKSGAIGTAVSSLDAARVLQVVAGMISFSNMQRLACDSTGDGTISSLDAVRILQLSAGVIDRLPVATECESDWLFYPTPDATQNQSLITPSLTLGSCRAGGITLNPMLTSASNQDFDGILFGDCTGNWTPAIGGALRLQASSGVTVHAGSPRRAPGGRFRIPIYVQALDTFHALDVKVGYDRNAVTLRAVTPRGAAANALTSVNTDDPDRVSVSLASAAPIDDNAGAVLFLEFANDAGSEDATVWLMRASVDEQSARVVTHGGR
jgi:sugar lactone lactonase YvrE